MPADNLYLWILEEAKRLRERRQQRLAPAYQTREELRDARPGPEPAEAPQ